MNNYSLNKLLEGKGKVSIMSTLKKFLPFLKDEKKNLVISITAVTVNFALNLVAPILLGYTVDHYIQTKQYSGVLIFSGILLVIYLFSLVATYCQTWFTGKIGQNTLFKLRKNIFNKLQSLPLAFFNANKAGDLISRINNDTDKLNTFLSQGFVQFVANGFAIVGTGIFILFINWKLALASLAPALFLLIFTRIISPWM